MIKTVFLNKKLGLLLLSISFLIQAAFAQEIQVSGTVTDNAGLLLPGVSVLVQGTNTGTITDEKGAFSISVSNDAILEFSFIGMEKRIEPVNGRTIVNVILMESNIGIEEVVAIGYGTMKKSDLTGSVMSVGAEKFEAQPLTKIDQALQGRAAGVQVVQTTGAPGATMKIRIRGANSISGSNNPLYVVDGMVVNDIGSISVNDIASMEVLKDASATAIYGSRGANGVVLITTKTGKKGMSKITIETFHGISNIFQELPMMTAGEYAEAVNFAEGKEIFTQAEIDELYTTGGVNWQKELFKTAPSHNYVLSFSGGNDMVDYFVSGSLYDAEGTIINQNYKRYTVRANINAQVTNNLKIGTNIAGAREEDYGTRANLSDGLTYDPTTPIYDENGDYIYASEKNLGNSANNPIINPMERIKDNFQNRLTATGYLDLSILEGLVLNISGGVEYFNIDNNAYVPITVNGRGNATENTSNTYTLQNTNRLTYIWDQMENHRLQVDAIHEQQYFKNKFLNANAEQFFSDATTYKDMALGQIQVIDNGERASSLQSFLGRVNYSFADKYLFTASLRADGSSRFQEGNQWGYFPSGSVAWRASQENFIQQIESISNLKVRASYGITGSQAIAIYATRSRSLTGID